MVSAGHSQETPRIDRRGRVDSVSGSEGITSLVTKNGMLIQKRAYFGTVELISSGDRVVYTAAFVQSALRLANRSYENNFIVYKEKRIQS